MMDGGTMTMQMRPPFSGPPPRFMGGGPRMMGGGGGMQTPTRPSYMSQVRQQLIAGQGVLFDGKRMRKAIHRKTVDYNSAVIKYLENRVWQRDHRDLRAIQPDPLYQIDCVPPTSMLHNAMNCVTTKFVRTSTNKFRCPIFVLTWTPEGRRLVTGASSGEFTLWNGLTFNFETILQAHDVSVRAMRWTHNDQWMVTADHAGFIKYWQSNMNNVKMYQGHKEPIRGISFCPTDSKFSTCSDDGTVRVWDFLRCQEERILRGHGADVKCVDWHPQKSLVASGSKDNQQPVKLWDPKSGTSLATIHAHKHTVMDLKWNKNGNWLLTASRDHLLKIYDIRNMKEDMQTFKGHKKEATAISWHPIHEDLFVSGGSDGAVMFWIVGCDREVGSMEEAHEGMVWSLAWHPVGHILASGSNDHTTKFWTRNRLGDRMRDKYNLNNLPAGIEQEMLEYDQEPQAMPNLPGMGLEHGLPDHLKPQVDKPSTEEELPSIPGLDWSADEAFYRQQEAANVPRKKVPYARPIPKSFEQAWKDNKPGVIASEEAKAKSSGRPSPHKGHGGMGQKGMMGNQQGPPGQGGPPTAAMVTGPALQAGRGVMMGGPRGPPMQQQQNQMQQMQGPPPPFMMGGPQQQGGPAGMQQQQQQQQQQGFPPGQYPGPPGGHFAPQQGPRGFGMDPQGGMQHPMPGPGQPGGPRMMHQGPRFPPANQPGHQPGQDQGYGGSQQYGQETLEAGEDIDFRRGGGGGAGGGAGAGAGAGGAGGGGGGGGAGGPWNRPKQGAPMGGSGGYENYAEDGSDQDYRSRQSAGAGGGGMPRGGGGGGGRGGRGGGPPSYQRGGPPPRGPAGSYEASQYNQQGGTDNWGDQDFRQGGGSMGQYGGGQGGGRQNYGDIDERMDGGGGDGDDIDERYAPRGRGRPIRGSGLMNRGRGSDGPPGGYRGARYNGPIRGGGGGMGGPGFRGQGEEEEEYYEGQDESPSRKRGWEEGPGRGGRGRSPGDPHGHKWGRSSGWQQDQEGSQRPYGRGGGGGGYRGNSRGRGDFRGRGNFRGR